jgi:sugar-specific transcriptional regulator TrmB
MEKISDRLEVKIDKVKDRLESKIDIIKEDVTELKTDMKYLMPKIEEHITGDKKIINALAPVIDKLPNLIEIVERDQYKKFKKAERNEKIKYYTSKLLLLSLVVGIGAGITKILGFFG